MFNLNNTRHEAGIILYGGSSVGVFNWQSCDDGSVPMLSPFGAPINWPADSEEDADLIHVGHVDDVRTYLPGSVWAGEDDLETDLDIVCDDNDDIPALWGFGPSAGVYADADRPYSGDIWDIPGGPRVITIDAWN